jgi:hypothetical protein
MYTPPHQIFDIAKQSSLVQSVQTGSVAFPAFYWIRTKYSFAGYKVAVEWTWRLDS